MRTACLYEHRGVLLWFVGSAVAEKKYVEYLITVMEIRVLKSTAVEVLPVGFCRDCLVVSGGLLSLDEKRGS